MEFKVYRDSDARRLPKVVIEVWHEGRLLNRARMYVGLFLLRLTFPWRLKLRMKMALKTAQIMLKAEESANGK